MNIRQAKQEITNTLKAYLAKDELGNYLIPSVRQRPVLLMGPPGIGKTQIMEQIAAEQSVGLVSYTITHHTRQSAVGLPFIETRMFDGQTYSVTEYTMSEILASVHTLMERTGLREGILFLDEINCVSETLAPMMLQFLQYKTFGNQRLPEGWLIVTAGNPPEYNRSVREFDVVTLDRVRRIDIREDYGAWREYALKKGLHGAVLSYLDIRKEHFYCMETTVDGLQFVTARGWEDLSELMYAYEKLDLKISRETAGQYLQLPRVAMDFANYLELYEKYRRIYQIEDILCGKWEQVSVTALRDAPFDEKFAVMGLLLSRLSESARNTWKQDAFTTAIHADLTAFRDNLTASRNHLSGSTAGDTANAAGGTINAAECVLNAPGDMMNAAGSLVNAAGDMAALADQRRETLERTNAAGYADPETRNLYQREIRVLEDYAQRLRQISADTSGNASVDAMEAVREWFAVEVEKRSGMGKETGMLFDNAFRFLEEAFGQSQELVLFVTEITAGFHTSWFVETFGCEAYFRHNRELLFQDRRRQIQDKIMEIRQNL